MGNTCSRSCAGRRSGKEAQPCSPALQIIREAQQKYFNSHIESDMDESDDDIDNDGEDMVDMFGSVDSLDMLDSASVDSQLDNSRSNIVVEQQVDTTTKVKSILRSGPPTEGDTASLSQIKSYCSVPPNTLNLRENFTADPTRRDSGNGSVTHIVSAAVVEMNASNGPQTTSTTAGTTTTDGDSTTTATGGVPNDNSAGNAVSYIADADPIDKGQAGQNSMKPVDCNEESAATPAKTSVGIVAKPGVKRRDKKRKYISLSKRGNFFSIFNTEDKKARSVDPSKYEYPFENLVFEGGGNKGLAYCGAVRLLEELNIWPQIKRLAGTSAGAMTAALLAVGYSSHDLEQFFSLNLNNIFLDHRFGYLSLIPNLLSSYGWNPGKRIYKWFGHKLADRTGNPDITFKEVYDMYQRELCIVATNLNQMTSLYCHPKTTPDMPVRLAVRMSMSIPGMFKAVKHTMYGQTDIFVDGGVLCNYPIHCFDGWWLSMEPENNFLEKLQPLEDIPRLLERTERFGQYNQKTLGMQLYSDNEQDLLKYQLENLRHGVQLQELPNTKLAREKIRKKKLQLKTDREHRRLVKAMNAFLRALRKHNLDKNDNIDREELQAALNDQELFPRSKRLILFGDVDCDIILEYLDRDHNGQPRHKGDKDDKSKRGISYQELIRFMEETGISMQNRFLGYQRRNIKNLPSFLDTLQATLLTNVKRVYVEERDLKRTVGINTGHVGTSDFNLEPADIEFVLERGKRSLEAFLKYYVASNRLKKKAEYRRQQVPRKDSKASLLSSDSNSSLGGGDDAGPGLSYAVANCLRQAAYAQHLSPIPSESGTLGEFVYSDHGCHVGPDTSGCDGDSNSINCTETSSTWYACLDPKPLLCHAELATQQESHLHSKSTSSTGKSVSISDNVTFMTDRRSSQNNTEDRVVFSSDIAEEDVWLDESERDLSRNKAPEHLPLLSQTINIGQESQVSVVRMSDIQGSSPPFPCAFVADSPATGNSACEKSDVLAHRHTDTEDNPTTPLLESDVFGNVALKLQDH